MAVTAAANGDTLPGGGRGGAEIYVLDASAAVEYLLESEAGQRVGGIIAGGRLVAPEMLDAEVLSGLRSKVMRGQIDEARALTALQDLAVMPVERVSHRGLTRQAWQYYRNVTAYDAMYVAVAEIYGATLVTADGHLSRAPGLGIAVVVVEVSAG